MVKRLQKNYAGGVEASRKCLVVTAKESGKTGKEKLRTVLFSGILVEIVGIGLVNRQFYQWIARALGFKYQ